MIEWEHHMAVLEAISYHRKQIVLYEQFATDLENGKRVLMDSNPGEPPRDVSAEEAAKARRDVVKFKSMIEGYEKLIADNS